MHQLPGEGQQFSRNRRTPLPDGAVMGLHLKPGLRAVLERLPDGRMRLHWILVSQDDVRGLGTFEGSEAEVLAALERGRPEVELGARAPR